MDMDAFTREHARQVAEIHAEGQTGTFLTRLGLDFLTALYTAMADSAWAFGNVVIDGDTVAGVGIVAFDTGQLFRDIKRQYWRRLLWPVMRQVIRQPSLIGEIAQSLRYPATLAAPPGEAEILFMGLRRSYMRRGIGPRLLDHILDEAYRRGCILMRATINRRNRPMRWMIATLPGVYIDQEIELNGQTMLVYRAQLPLDSRQQTIGNGQSSQ